MKDLIKQYLSIIHEIKYSNKKWRFDSVYNDFEIYFNLEHIKDRLDKRYETEDLLLVKKLILYIITYIIDNKIFEKEKFNFSKKFGYTQGFTFHSSITNFWICGSLQKDIDNTKRIYCSTLLSPNEHEHQYRNADIFIEIDI